MKGPLHTLPSTGLDILIVGGICDDDTSNKCPTSKKYSRLLANCFLKSTNHHPLDPESSTKAKKKKKNQSTTTTPLLDSIQKYERKTFIQRSLSARHIYIALSISSFFHGHDKATKNQQQNDLTSCDDDNNKKKSCSNNTTENTTSLSNRVIIDKETLVCLLCRRKFHSLNHLNRHLKLSQLHKSNLEKFMKEQVGKRIEKEVENNQRLQKGQAEEEASNSIEQQANDQDQQPFSKKRKLSVVECANNNSSAQKHVQQPRIDFILWVMSASDLINLSSRDNDKKVFLDRMYTHNLSPDILHSDYIYLKRIIIVVISSPEEEKIHQGLDNFKNNVLIDLLHKYKNNLNPSTSLLKKWILQDHLIPVYQCTNTENSLFQMSRTILRHAKLSSRTSLTSETNASSVTMNSAKTSGQSEARSNNHNFGDSAGLSPLFYSILF